MELKLTTKDGHGTIFSFLAASIPVLLGIYVFLVPFPHTTTIKEICYYLSVLVVVALFLFRKIQFSFQTPLAVPGILFVTWCFFGLFFAVNPANSIHDFYAHLLKYILLYFILINGFFSLKRLSALSWILIASASSLFVWRLYYYYVKLGTPFAERFGACFTEVTTNLIGIIAVVSIVFSIHNISQAKGWPRRIFFASCLLPALTVIFLAQTRSVLLALVVSLVVVLFARKKVLVGVLSLLAVILSLSPVGGRFTSNMADNLRIKHGLLVWEVVKDYPVTGIGFGMQTFGGDVDLQRYNARLPERFQGQEILSNPHNMYTDIAVRTGIPGIIFFLGIMFSFFRILWQSRKNGASDGIVSFVNAVFAAGLSFFIIGFFEPVFSHYPESVLCVIFSMGTILWRINRDSRPSMTEEEL
ncbi:MAG: O-antigen ligase family protein [Desulfurivibrionaceae bacterium]|jgi:O-antigen ligase